MVLGYIYSVTGRYRLAEFEFTKVNEMGLQSSQAFAALGYVYYAQRKVPESVETLSKALELEPRNPNALNSLGFIYAEEKIDIGRAVSSAARPWRSRPATPPTWIRWGGPTSGRATSWRPGRTSAAPSTSPRGTAKSPSTCGPAWTR